MENNRVIRSHLVGQNVPRWERVASVLVGGGLIGFGASRRSIPGGLLALVGGGLVFRGVTGRCGVYRMRAVRKSGVEFRRAVTIQCTANEVYELWRDLRNLPRFMERVERIEIESDRVSRWVVDVGPKKLEWRAEIIEDTPGRRLRWRSIDGDLDHEGTLDLVEAPGGRGTVVDVRMRYMPPGGVPVAGLLFGALRKLPGIQLAEELARLRMLIETGELATGARNPAELQRKEKVLTAMEV
jgi:uncharacterized membrane protein